jgi:hypothetical protein
MSLIVHYLYIRIYYYYLKQINDNFLLFNWYLLCCVALSFYQRNMEEKSNTISDLCRIFLYFQMDNIDF